MGASLSTDTIPILCTMVRKKLKMFPFEQISTEKSSTPHIISNIFRHFHDFSFCKFQVDVHNAKAQDMFYFANVSSGGATTKVLN